MEIQYSIINYVYLLGLEELQLISNPESKEVPSVLNQIYTALWVVRNEPLLGILLPQYLPKECDTVFLPSCI